MSGGTAQRHSWVSDGCHGTETRCIRCSAHWTTARDGEACPSNGSDVALRGRIEDALTEHRRRFWQGDPSGDWLRNAIYAALRPVVASSGEAPG